MADSASLKEVAKRAGVSTATVSRVVNARKGTAESTRRRVQAAIDELGYAPDPQLGRFFKTMNGGVKSVAFAVHPSLYRKLAISSDAFYPRMSLAVQAELSRRNHHMILANSGTDGTGDGNLTCVAQGLCNGVVGQLRDATVVARLAKHVPVVLLNADHDVPFVDVVIPNVERAAQRQLAYLVERGHRTIACYRPQTSRISDAKTTWQDKRYLPTYRHFCRDHGLPLPTEYLEPDFCEPDGDAAAIAHFIERVFDTSRLAPTAILTYDGYAGELIRQLAARGLEVPRDVSIVGYDDCTFNHPCPLGLTTFRQDFETMAKEAVRLLLERIREPGRPAVLVEVEGQLIERESSAVRSVASS